MFEVENKFPIEDLAATETQVSALGCSFGSTIVQVDQYFNHPVRDFAETDEALRIRSVGDANRLTYKGPKVDQQTKTRREIEFPLGEGGETAERMAETLLALGFRAVREVRKERRIGQFEWQGFAVEASLDQIDGLGDFLEIEISAEEQQMEAARDSLVALADELGLGTPERRSYLEMVLALG